jgi:hypothetical protein
MHKQHIEQSCFLIYATQFIKMIWKSVKPKFFQSNMSIFNPDPFY